MFSKKKNDGLLKRFEIFFLKSGYLHVEGTKTAREKLTTIVKKTGFNFPLGRRFVIYKTKATQLINGAPDPNAIKDLFGDCRAGFLERKKKKKSKKKSKKKATGKYFFLQNSSSLLQQLVQLVDCFLFFV